MFSEGIMLVEPIATAFVASFVGIAVLGHVFVLVALLPKRRQRLKLRPQS
jgi:hypothetical protein